MKKVFCYAFLSLLILLFSHTNAAAQCSGGDSWFSCYSVSGNQHLETNSQDWYSDGTLFYITVNLNTNSGDSYAYAEITTPDFYQYNMVTDGDDYQDNFYAPGETGQLLRLFTAARNGLARVDAQW